MAAARSTSSSSTRLSRNLVGFLFRGLSKKNVWYLIGILVPVAAVSKDGSSRAVAEFP